jgi:hypothetical protein
MVLAGDAARIEEVVGGFHVDLLITGVQLGQHEFILKTTLSFRARQGGETLFVRSSVSSP